MRHKKRAFFTLFFVLACALWVGEICTRLTERDELRVTDESSSRPWWRGQQLWQLSCRCASYEIFHFCLFGLCVWFEILQLACNATQLCRQKIKVSGVEAAGELGREIGDASGEYLSVKRCQTLLKLLSKVWQTLQFWLQRTPTFNYGRVVCSSGQLDCREYKMGHFRSGWMEFVDNR